MNFHKEIQRKSNLEDKVISIKKEKKGSSEDYTKLKLILEYHKHTRLIKTFKNNLRLELPCCRSPP